MSLNTDEICRLYPYTQKIISLLFPIKNDKSLADVFWMNRPSFSSSHSINSSNAFEEKAL